MPVNNSVVGYNQYPLYAGGYTIYTPTFEKIDGNKKLDLQTLKLVGSEGWGTDQIWMMTEDGTAATGETYTWKNADASGVGHDCWWDDQNDCEATGVEVGEGDGFYIYADGEGISIQAAGGVKLNGYSRPMVAAGYTMTGNFSPIAVDLQKIKLVGSEGWGTDQIWVMTEDGTAATGETYTWKNADASGVGHDCWWDDQNDCEATGITIEPGQGLYIYCDGEGISLTIDTEIKAN